MSTLALPDVDIEPQPRRWSRDEYFQMVDSGILRPEERLELADGQIYLRGEGRLRPWTRDEYHRLADIGVLGEDEHLELIDGEIIQKVSPMGVPHTTAVLRTASTLEKVFGEGYHVRYQMALAASAYSEPEPDVMVLPGAIDDYDDHQPSPAEALLIVEVSDSTLRTDRGRKARAYAGVGVSDYWIVNLRQRLLEVHRSPGGSGYQNVASYGEAESVEPLAAVGRTVHVSSLLPLARPPRD